MLFDWDTYTNIHVTADFSMPVSGLYSYTLTTLDGDGDGVIGNAMVDGPFPGFNIIFAGTVTTTCPLLRLPGIWDADMLGTCGQAYPLGSVVPLPSAVWLLGSGLAGLLGLGCIRKRGNMCHT